MGNIKLPKKFKLILEANQALNGTVNSTLGTFSDILNNKTPYFFAEYTDHGIEHIENILFSSENLVTETTFNGLLSEKDIGFYVLAVILHDIGMHLTLDSFNQLIEGAFDDVIVKEFDTQTWKDLWSGFLNDAKKFNGKKLKSVFGDENYILTIPTLDQPGEISDNDKKLIGEFLRINHPRLAHEIAVKGLPGKSGVIEFAKELSVKEKNIIGLIARSHGIGLRYAVDYIEKEFGRNNRTIPLGIHATYLMVLLRLADYIQIKSDRTSVTLLKIKRFSSPVSENEHNAHLAIDSIDNKYQSDPERIFVSASPADSKMFIKLNKLINDIQYEFDISWAVLGEIYGATKEKPAIRYRRITSNLMEDRFKEGLSYIPDNFMFKANDDVIRLLIAPLYGNEPTFGVRELLQNAIDACREREAIERRVSNPAYEGNILIEVKKEEDGKVYLIVEDNGMGMDQDIIKNYFLSAGASYRKSLEWQREFTNENGVSKIKRSGRFGVGILAAFLIGKSIEVKTKKLGALTGFKFSADLNAEHINILKTPVSFQGTSIKIEVDESTLGKFALTQENRSNTYTPWFKWFTLKRPTITYRHLGKDLAVPLKPDPDLSEKLPGDWNAIDYDGYDKILWTYNKDYSSASPFTCNGLIIPQINQHRVAKQSRLNLIVQKPRISVFDSNALLPLTLDRNNFSGVLPFYYELLVDIYKDFIACLLMSPIQAPSYNNQTFLVQQELFYPGFARTDNLWKNSYGIRHYNFKKTWDNYLVDSVLLSKEGFIINYNYFLQRLKKIKVLFINCSEQPSEIKPFNLDLKDWFLNFNISEISTIDEYIKAIEPSAYDDASDKFSRYDARIFMKSNFHKYLYDPTKKRVTVFLRDKTKVAYSEYGWTCLHLDTAPEGIITKKFLKDFQNDIHFMREHEITCPYDGDSIFDKLLQKYIGEDVLIPYSLPDRKKKFPVAFEELSRYMEKFKGWKKK